MIFLYLAVNLDILFKKCDFLEKFILPFFFEQGSIRTEYREIRSVSPYSVRKRENADQNNPKYEHFSRSEKCKEFLP